MAKRTCVADDCDKGHKARGLCRSHYAQLRRRELRLSRPRPTPEQRFWIKVDKNGPLPVERPDLGNCWVWRTAKRDSTRVSFVVKSGSKVLAHRMGYELIVGPIPDGLVLDHLCRRPRCVRFSHLEPVTQATNIARGLGPALLREWDAKKRALTHCKWGHEYTPPNTRIKKNGTRGCKACARRSFAEWRKRPDVRERQNAYHREYYARRKASRLAEAV